MSLARTNISRQAAAIANLYDVVETNEYKTIVRIVSSVATDGHKQHNYNSRILMAGVGKNANIASKIAETMASLGIPAMPLNVSHMGHGDFGYVGYEDVVIHISRSGTTREMLFAMEHLAAIRPGVTQILIHCKPTKPKNEFVDIELCIGGVQEGDEHGLAPTTSTTALLCILDCISVEASHAAGFQRIDFLQYHPDGALGAMLKTEQAEVKSKEQTEPGREFN